MARRMSKEQRKAAFLAAADEAFEELEAWYDAHPDATFGEIEEEARKKRRELMGKALEIVVNGRDSGYQYRGHRVCQVRKRDGLQGRSIQADDIQFGRRCSLGASVLRLPRV